MKLKQVPALKTNKFSAFVNSDVRLVFADEVLKGDDDENYHSAVIMSRSDARSLADLLNRLLDEAEKKDEKAH